jgi:hypothetical protein
MAAGDGDPTTHPMTRVVNDNTKDEIMASKPPREWLVRLLGAAVGATLARLFMPPEVRGLVFVIGIPAFLIWLWWDTHRSNRDLAEHLDRLQKRKREYRQAKEAARPFVQKARAADNKSSTPTPAGDSGSMSKGTDPSLQRNPPEEPSIEAEKPVPFPSRVGGGVIYPKPTEENPHPYPIHTE